MPNFNKVIICGHMTREPELASTKNNMAICKFGLAVNHKFKDKEEVCFIDCVAWGKQGETIAEYTGKGSALLVEGRLKLDKFTDRTGTERTKHCVVVENFTFVGGPRGGQRRGGEPSVRRPAEQYQPTYAPPTIPDDDIPF